MNEFTIGAFIKQGNYFGVACHSAILHCQLLWSDSLRDVLLVSDTVSQRFGDCCRGYANDFSYNQRNRQ
jgi:hypothetical protein